MRTRTYVVLSLLAVLAGWGCGDTAPKRRNAGGAIGGAGLTDANALNSAPAAPQPPADGQVPTGMAGQPSAQQIPAVPAANPAEIPGVPGTASAAPAAPGTVTVPAAPGVTGKGNYKPGIITTPISVYFRVQEQLIFGQVKHAIDLYEGSNGYKPRSQEEFMKEIIEANQLKLPKLPDGHTYKYDPMKGELMVEQPG
ncbi:MAG TPA: hypothetical protein VMV69_28705 [Pirellulales bacterium]|nr:hypothetical protein [Pirellulales bacterium]